MFSLLCSGRSWSKGRKRCARSSWTTGKYFTIFQSSHFGVCHFIDKDVNLLLRAHQVRSFSRCPSREVPSPSALSTPASCCQRTTLTCLLQTPLALSSWWAAKAWRRSSAPSTHFDRRSITCVSPWAPRTALHAPAKTCTSASHTSKMVRNSEISPPLWVM